MAAVAPVRVRGRVSSIAFRDDRTGETRARVIPVSGVRGSDSIYTFQCNCVFPPVVGEEMELLGTWSTDRRGEPVLIVTKFDRHAPTTREGEEIFLRGFIKGMTRQMATTLLDRYGNLAGLIEACDKRPEDLLQALPKHRKVVARLRLAQWNREEKDIDLFAALYGAGVRTDQLQRLIAHFTAPKLKVVAATKPYDVIAAKGIGFGTAEKIAFYYATKHGRTFDVLDPDRLLFGVCDVLAAERQQGHVCVPEAHLVERVLRTLRAPDKDGKGARLPRTDEVRAKIGAAVSDALKRRMIVKEFDMLYTLGMQRVEVEIALAVTKLLKEPASAEERRKIERHLASSNLTDEQKAAVIMAIEQPISVVTGGPGVGKTHTTAKIVEALKLIKRSFKVLAPTGKAAKRAADMIKEEASTIHRACGLDKEEDVHSKRYGRDLKKDDYFTVEHLIIDESSMIDAPLGFEVLRRIRRGLTRITWIGDVDQLPPVGPGQVFKDLIASGVIPVQRLTKIFRQAGGSPIIDGAYAINSGRVPEIPADSWEVKLLDPTTSKDYRTDGDDDARAELEADISIRWMLYTLRRFKEEKGLDPIRDAQVFAPQRTGPLGLERLNTVLREYFNPIKGEARGDSIRIQGKFAVQEGTKVIQMANNYRLRYAASAPAEATEEIIASRKAKERTERKKKASKKNKAAAVARAATDVISVMNGQVGFVSRVDLDLREIEVKFEDLPYPVLYKTGEEWRALAPAYAISVHKSQGSETPLGILMAHSGQHMLNRALVYTGWTRAKKADVWIGPMATLRRAVESTNGMNRYSNLDRRLRAHVEMSPTKVAR